MNKDRLLAIFMLISFGFSLTAMVLGTVNGNEPLVLSGFGVMIAVFLYSLYVKKKLKREFEEEQAKRNAKKAQPDGTENAGDPGKGDGGDQ